MNNLCMCSHISDEEEEDNGVCEAIVIYFLVRLVLCFNIVMVS